MLRTISGVEVFSAGTWNGDDYTEADLDEMVRAFTETSKTFRPPLKLGHDNNQSLLQQDGLPAAGWVANIYRDGKKLLADLIDIPQKIYDLIEKGAYKKVSCEVYWNASMGETKYRRMLGAIALLGADMPGVMNLDDIMARYKAFREQGGDLRLYSFAEKRLTIEVKGKHPEEKRNMKTELELKLESELEAEKKKTLSLSEQVKTTEKTASDKDAEIARLTKLAKDEADAKAEAEKKLLATALEREVTELASEKLITKAMRPYVAALLGEEKKEYSLKPEGATEEKKFSKASLVKEILKLHSAAGSVNTDEGSESGKVEGESDEKAILAKIQTYQKEHKCDYRTAHKAVMASLEKA